VTAKLARNKVTIASALAVLLMSLLAYLVVVGPKRSRANELEGSIAEARAELSQARIDEGRAKSEPVVPVADLFRLTKAMPNRADMPGILLDLARVAQETGISFDSIEAGEPTPVSGYQKVPVNLIFQGNFFELSDFFFRLRNLVRVRNNRLDVDGRLFAIEGIDFGQGSDQFPQIQATVTASAFVYGAPPAVPQATPQPTQTTSTSAAGAH
jgi:type IV pilus assembly PilO-like protein